MDDNDRKLLRDLARSLVAREDPNTTAGELEMLERRERALRLIAGRSWGEAALAKLDHLTGAQLTELAAEPEQTLRWLLG